MMQRRSFLGAMLAAAAAPAIVRASVLMPIYVPKPMVLTLWGDGIRDDTLALQALIHGSPVLYRGERYVGRAGSTVTLPAGVFLLAATQTLAGHMLHLQGGGAKLIRSPLMREGPALNFQRPPRLIEDIKVTGFDTAVRVGGAA